MTNYDILSIGHISLDYNVDCHDNQVVELGGAVVFSSAAAYAIGKKAGVVTKIPAELSDRLNALLIPREDVFALPAEKGTSIRNKYFTENKEKRQCTCLSQSDRIYIDDIPSNPCKIYHLAGLIYGDFDENLIGDLAKKSAVAVDVQGYLRHADGDGTDMYFKDWENKKDILPYITYLKTDAAEAEILTGLTDRYEAAKVLHSWGAKEIVITHNTEVIAYDGKEMYACPIKARNLSGRSGRGDTTFASYLAARIDNSLDKSLLLATATVSAKMENPGPYRGSRSDIEQYIADFYKDSDVRRIL